MYPYRLNVQGSLHIIKLSLETDYIFTNLMALHNLCFKSEEFSIKVAGAGETNNWLRRHLAKLKLPTNAVHASI